MSKNPENAEIIYHHTTQEGLLGIVKEGNILGY